MSKAPASREPLLVELREAFDYATDQWREIRKEGQTDMRYVAGDPWEPKDRKAREDAGRPALSLDELGQYHNQTINDVRGQPLSMKFAPTGNGANDTGAEFYQNKAREIEYRSHAQVAYVTAYENAVERGYGFVRVNTKYAHDRSMDQDITIEPLPNPDLVTADPDALMPDGSDQQVCFIHERRSVKQFRKQFPKASIQDFGPDIIEAAPSWLAGEQVRLAETWRVETKPRILIAFTHDQQPGRVVTVFQDEADQHGVPPGWAENQRRTVQFPRVKKYLINGVEVLEETDWPGRYIPIIWCLGKVLYVDLGGGSKRIILSQTRLARDAAMLYCYYRTAEAEVVGRVPKIPAIGYEGQFDGHEAEWQESVHQPKAYLTVKPTTDATGQQVLPLPQMQTWEPPIQALELGAEAARRAIQAAMGISPMPTAAQRRNEKSGKALIQIEASQQKGSFHFKDHYMDMIRQVGVVVEDLMDKIYDTARDVGIRKPDESAEIVRVNDPTREGSVSTKGDYLVTVSAGPSFESEREAASDFADTLANIPAVFMQIADLVIKLKNLGPIGDQIAERLTPPQYRAQMGTNGKPDPQAASKELAGTKQQLAQLEQAAQQMKQALETEQAKQQATIQKAHIDADREIQIQKMRDATSISVAMINARAKGVQIEQEGEVESIALAQEQLHEAVESEADRAHAVAMAAQAHAHALQAGEQQHAQGLEAGAVQADQQLTAQQQAEQAAAAQAEQAQAAAQPEGKAEA